MLPQTEKHLLTRDGDLVDRIAWDYYGQTGGGVVELVFQRNLQVLSRYRAILPAGVLLILPVIPTTSPGFQLWNYPPETVYSPNTKTGQDTLGDVETDLSNYRLSKST